MGGVNRSTPIDLKTIDNEVAKIAGRSPRTPIDMQSLWNEVQNLKATAKSWEIVTLKLGNREYPFNAKYLDYNFVVLNGRMGITENGYVEWTDNGSVRVFPSKLTNSEYDFEWIKSGYAITPLIYGKYIDRDTITVLFYK